MRKAGQEAGRGKVWLANANFRVKRRLRFCVWGLLYARLARRQAKAKSDWQMLTSA